MTSPTETVLDRLKRVKRSGDGWTARCPAHDDRKPSLSVSEGDDGRVLLNCFAGCPTENIVEALSLTMADLFPAEADESWNPFGDEAKQTDVYEYVGEDGTVRFEVVRFELIDPLHPAYPAKDFRQRVPGAGWGRKERGVEPVLYRLPEVLEAAADARVVFVVEGEKDVHTLEELGFVATTNPQGAGDWKDRYAAALKGAHVVILPDNDEEGRKHAESIAQSVDGVAASVRVVELPGLLPRGDVTEWVEAGHTRQELKQLAVESPVWTPSDAGADQEHSFGVLASDVEAERVAWLWERRLPLGELTILDGNPGDGKSTLLVDLAARVSMGRPMPQAGPPEETIEGGVVLVTTEDSPSHTIRPRLEAAGADLNRVLIVPTVPGEEGDSRPLVLPADVAKLEQAIRRVSARLVVIDPLMAHLGGSVNAHKDADVRRALAPLARLAQRLSVAVVVVRHLNKSGGTAAIYRGGGSIGIIGAARVGLLLGRHPENDEMRVVAPIKNNLTAFPSALAFTLEEVPEHGVARINWMGAVDFTADDLLRRSDGRGRTDERRQKACDFLQAALADGPRLASELYDEADATGIAKKTLKRAKRSLDVKSYRDEFQGPWKWRLSKGASTAISDNSGPLRANGSQSAPENGSKSAFNSAQPKEATQLAPEGGKTPKEARNNLPKSASTAAQPKGARNTPFRNGDHVRHAVDGRHLQVVEVSKRVALVEDENGCRVTVASGDLVPEDRSL